MDSIQIIRILGLDDDPDMHLIIKDSFKYAGVNNQCEFYAKKEDFFHDFDDNVHVAIVDHYLGGANVGFEIVQEIQQRVQKSPTRLAGCEIIIVSGQRNYDVLKKYNRMGVFDYIDKDEKEFTTQLVESTKKALEISHHWLKYLHKWNGGLKNTV